MTAIRCPRCRSRWHTDCFDPVPHTPIDGWLLVLAVVISWTVIGLIFFGSV